MKSPNKKSSNSDRDQLYQLRAVQGLGWPEIYPRFPHIPPHSQRRIVHSERAKRNDLPPSDQPPVPAVSAAPCFDEASEELVWEAVLNQARQRKAKELARSQQAVEFDHGPVALVFVADLHLGGSGVDYDRLDRDIALVENTPGMYFVAAGDWLDNYVIGKLVSISADMDASIMTQWALVKRILKRMAPKLIISVGGNHDKWTKKVAHIDYLADLHQIMAPQVIYHSDQATVQLRVGESEYRVLVRHKWRGHSKYNETHGIESAYKWGQHFDVAVGAHDHAGSLVREFSAPGRTVLAVKCGSYKVFDDFAVEVGFPEPNGSAMPVVIFEEDGLWGTGRLHLAARYMRRTYRKP
jgi:hypothetical protein